MLRRLRHRLRSVNRRRSRSRSVTGVGDRLASPVGPGASDRHPVRLGHRLGAKLGFSGGRRMEGSVGVGLRENVGSRGGIRAGLSVCCGLTGVSTERVGDGTHSCVGTSARKPSSLGRSRGTEIRAGCCQGMATGVGIGHRPVVGGGSRRTAAVCVSFSGRVIISDSVGVGIVVSRG